MKPPWAIDEYASIRTMLVCRSAARLPNVMEAAARIQTIGCHESLELKNPNLMIVSRATKPPAFDATDRNAVTGVGAPS